MTKKELQAEIEQAKRYFGLNGGEIRQLYTSTRGRTTPVPRVRWAKIAKLNKGQRDYHPTT